jgi:AcrR family transcriptional regulator
MTIVINRRERKRAALRAQILSTGIDLFSRYGVGAVTVDQIAAAADVGKGTIYNYFSAKEDLVVAFMADLEARLAPKVARFAPGNQPLERILAQYILLHLRLKQPYHTFVRVFFAQMFLDTERFIPYMLEIQKYTDPPLQSLLTELQQRGKLRPDLDLAQLIMSLKTMHLGLTAFWAIEGPPFRHTVQTVRWQMQFFSEGIKRKAQ